MTETLNPAIDAVVDKPGPEIAVVDVEVAGVSDGEDEDDGVTDMACGSSSL